MSQTDNSATAKDYRDAIRRFALDYARQLLRTPNGEQLLNAARVLRKSHEYIQRDPQLQKDIKELHEIKKSLASRDQLALDETHDAAWGMALSGNLGEYKKYAEQLASAQTKIGEIEKIRDIDAIKTLGDDAKSIGENLERIRDSNDDAPVPDELLDSSAKTLALLASMGGELTNIRASVGTLIEVSQCNMETAKQQLESVEKLLETAKHNETSSEKNAQSSNQLAKWAIIIAIIGIFANAGIQWHFACRAEKNDKTGELIEVVKKSHPWYDLQISTEEAKNVGIAFRVVTTAMQENVQNRHEISRLQAELKKTQDWLGEVQKKHDELVSVSEQAQKQLQREINPLKRQIASLQSEVTSLKKQIEELKKQSISKTIPAVPEVKNE